MKHLKKNIGITTAAIVLSLSQTAYATPKNIADGYIGGDNHNYGDVIGNANNFDIRSMDGELIGNTLSVSINTAFAGKADNHLFDSLTNNKGIGYGDLFLSSAWTPFGSAPYTDDNNTNGTVWSYGFSLDDRWMSETQNGSAGSGTLYSLNSGNNNADALLSEDFLTSGTFRNGQGIAVDTVNGNVTAITGNSSWNITAGKVNFLIDLTGTTLANDNTIALHWGMTCGNDTIEGQFSSLPEPAVISLLLAGLAGIGIARRKSVNS